MSVQITERDFYNMRNQRDQARTMTITREMKLNQLRARIAELETCVKNANIAATSLQIQNVKFIAEITRLTAFNESMQTDARKNTETINKQAAEINTIKSAIEDVKYYVGNPSAWEHYDDGVSEKIRAILKAAGMA